MSTQEMSTRDHLNGERPAEPGSAEASAALSPEEIERRDAFAGRLFQTCLSSLEALTIDLGGRLGLYQALADGGPAIPPTLAERTGVHERYAREWLEQQAAAGILTVDDVSAPASERTYRLPAGHAEALLDRNSLNYLAPLMRLPGGIAPLLPALMGAYRTGGGVPWAAYGDEGRQSQAEINRPAFLTLLGSAWLPSIQDVHARLQADPPARIADIACGFGWSSIAMARAYPRARVDGFDLDAPSIEAARAIAAREGLADRVRFSVSDAAGGEFAGRYDLVTVFEALHDMAHPVEALRTIRSLLADDGVVIVMDEGVGETFSAPADDVERLMYACSLLVCLPNGMVEQPSAGTGTVMRPATLRRYAQEAGFREVEILPIEFGFFRFYRLRI